MVMLFLGHRPGALGFKGSKKATPFAAQMAVKRRLKLQWSMV